MAEPWQWGKEFPWFDEACCRICGAEHPYKVACRGPSEEWPSGWLLGRLPDGKPYWICRECATQIEVARGVRLAEVAALAVA